MSDTSHTAESKVVSEHELSPGMKTLWQKASKAARAQNFEYVVNLLQNIVAEEPHFLTGRRTLRRAEVQLQKPQKKRIRISAPSISLIKLKSQISKNPIAAMISIEEELAKDPINPNSNQLLYEAALAAEMPETAAFALETIRDANPNDKEVLKQLAKHFMGHGEPHKAQEMYNAVLAIDNTDLDAVKGVTHAAAEASMRQNKWEDGGARRDDAERIRQEEASRQHMTRDQILKQLEDLGEKYAEDNQDLMVVRKIAGFYEQLQEWDSALSYWDWAFQISKGDSALEAKAAEVRDKKRSFELKQMEKDIEADPDAPDAAEKRQRLAVIKKERIQEQVGEARDRVERNPTDPQLRYDLARHLVTAENFDAAIPELQRAKSNPHVRISALVMLGRCFENKNMLDLAHNQLDEANKELSVMDNTKEEVLYAKAMILEKMGKKEDYLDCLKQIYESDYNYRDVAQRVEASYSAG